MSILKSYKQLNEMLDENEAVIDIPRCKILSDLINECVVFSCSTSKIESLDRVRVGILILLFFS